MTIEKLLEYSPEDLDKLSPEELKNFWEPFLKVTRPEFVKTTGLKFTGNSSSKKHKPTDGKQRAEELIQLLEKQLAAGGVK